MAEMPAEASARKGKAGTDRPIAVIAGAGELPLAMAQAIEGRGREVFIVAVEGEADQDFALFDHIRLPIGAAGRLLEHLRARHCTEVMMAGVFHRPRFSEIEFDLGTLKLAVSSLLRLRFGGDDQVVRRVVDIFEAEGFRIVGPREAVPEMIAGAGALGRLRPAGKALADIDHGAAALRCIGRFAIRQAVVVHQRRIIAVEAAEGTSAMIARCADLRANGRLNAPAPSGIFVKTPKPGQETRIEMPVIGPDTVHEAIKAGLAGIAVEAGGVLFADRAGIASLADEAGLFVFGFPPQ